MNTCKIEIKSVLDADPENRELLFRRGYLLTSKRQVHQEQFPFYNQWKELELNRYYLYVHTKQTAYVARSDSVCAAIVGHAYNPFNNCFREEEIAAHLITAYQEGLPQYFEAVSELTGLHVILLVDRDRIIACQDACALTGCYFGLIGNEIYVTEHPQLTADLCDLTMDPMVEKLVTSKCYNIGNRHLPGNLTPYKELKRLGANTYLNYDGQFTINRFFPTAPHPEYRTEDEIQKGVKRVAELLHNGIECCTKKWDRCAISLTGGTDSKTTLACANGLYDKFSYFSFHSKPQEMVDAEGAKKLCDQLGLEHTLYNIPESNDEMRDFDLIKKILAHNTSYFVNLADNEIRKYIFLHDLDAYDIELKSWASEVPRVFLERKYKIKMPKVLNERHCSIFQTRYFGHPKLLKWSDREYWRFLREIGLEKPLLNYEHTDSFYWEVRMSCWGVSVISSQQLYHRMTIPMNNRKILEMMLSFPREERKVDAIHKRIMEFMNPAVVDAKVEIRNLYFHSYRIWMEKLYYYYRTLFYRPLKK